MLMHPFRSNTWRSQITLHVLKICFVSTATARFGREIDLSNGEVGCSPRSPSKVRSWGRHREVATKNMHFFKNMKESRQTYENLMIRREAYIKSRQITKLYDKGINVEETPWLLFLEHATNHTIKHLSSREVRYFIPGIALSLSFQVSTLNSREQNH